MVTPKEHLTQWLLDNPDVTENSKLIITKQKELIAALTEGAKKDAEIITLYQNAEKINVSMIKTLRDIIEDQKKLIN